MFVCINVNQTLVSMRSGIFWRVTLCFERQHSLAKNFGKGGSTSRETPLLEHHLTYERVQHGDHFTGTLVKQTCVSIW